MQISVTFKNQQVLRDVNWDVKKGERVGLVGAFFNHTCNEESLEGSVDIPVR